jgi:MFS family permease
LTIDLTDPSLTTTAPAAGDQVGPWSRSHRRLTLGLLLTIVAGAFEALAVATVLPATVDDLGGLNLYGWVFGAFTLANLVGIVVAGGEIDRSGPRRPFAAGVVLFVVGLSIGGFAPTMGVLIAGRVVQGFASGQLSSVAYSSIGVAYPESVRPRMLALWATAWVVPGLIGPAIAGIVATEIGWRWVFFGIIPIPLIAAALIATPLRRLPTGSKKPRDRARLRDAFLLALGVTILLIGLGRDNAIFGVLLTAAGLLITAPPLRRLTPRGTFRAAPGPAAGVALLFLLNVGFFGVESFLPLALTDIRHRSNAFAGLPLTAAVITWTAGAWVLDHRAARAGRVSLVRFGFLTVIAGNALFAAVLRPETPVPVAILAWAVAGLGIGVAYSTLQLVILETAPKGEEGTSTSAMQLANALSIAFATGIGGAVVSALSTDDTATPRGILLQTTLMIAVLSLAVLTAGRLPERSSTEH